MKPASFISGLSKVRITSPSVSALSRAVLADRLAVDGQRVLVDQLVRHQFAHHGRHAAGAMIFLAEINPGRLQFTSSGTSWPSSPNP